MDKFMNDFIKSLKKPRTHRNITKGECKDLLNYNIKITTMEKKIGKIKTQPQAIAIGYSKTLKERPYCKRFFTKK